jgi:DNA repair protein RadC
MKDIPKWNRPGTKLLKKGEDKLNEAELLAIILEKGIRVNESSIDLANKLLKKYNLNKLSDLSLTELKKDVGEIKALKIKAMFEIFKTTMRVRRNGFSEPIETAKDVYNHFVDRLKDRKKEYFFALLLDSKNRIIKEELISVGTLNSSLVHPREVFKEAIKNSANAIILVHNHPSGDSEASEKDIEVNKKLMEAGNSIDIKILDHIIISNTGFFSIKN